MTWWFRVLPTISETQVRPHASMRSMLFHYYNFFAKLSPKVIFLWTDSIYISQSGVCHLISFLQKKWIPIYLIRINCLWLEIFQFSIHNLIFFALFQSLIYWLENFDNAVVGLYITSSLTKILQKSICFLLYSHN